MKAKTLAITFSVMILFVCAVIGVFMAVRSRIVTPEAGMLLLFCLLGLYVGFGILIGAYRLVLKLK